MDNAQKFLALINNAERILVSSHFSPDPDAVSSVLLLGTTLQKNFPAKSVSMVLEEAPARDLSFLTDYNKLEIGALDEAIESLNSELIVIVDAMNFERLSRRQASKISQHVKEHSVKVAVVDHHEEVDVVKNEVYINKKNPATVQELYELLFEELTLQKPSGYAETTLLGILSDTARHKYENPRHRQTFRIVSDLIDAGASVEKLESKLDRFTLDQLRVLENLLANIVDSGEGYAYSFVDGEFTDKWLAGKKSIDDFKLGFEEFTGTFLRNIGDNQWGFAVYPDLAAGEPDLYGVSFRAVSGTKDVAKLANQLGGGGHKPAAGAKLKAKNIDDALKQVIQAIEADK